MEVLYNAWQAANKQPFGAVKVGESVYWQITVINPAPVQQVALVLTKADQQAVTYPMKANDQGSYSFTTPLNDPGIYFYHFKIETDGQTYYFRHTLGGDGKLVTTPTEINDFQLTCYAAASPQPDWLTGAVVYQIFPDSFCNGNPDHEISGKKPNSFLYATEQDLPYNIRAHDGSIVRWAFYGGNLAGVKKQIPYFKKMGISVIYFNPIFAATSNHRYDTNDFLQIDPMLGNEKEFQDLVAALHAHGIKVILDGVFNHVGEDSRYFNAHRLYGKDTGATQDKDSPYFDWFFFTKYPTKYRSWWGVTTLPEVNKNNPQYQQFIYGDHGVMAKWNRAGVDGWRLDVADELPMDFLRQLRQRQEKDGRQVLIGEVWEDASNKRVNGELRSYIQGDNLTGTMNYPARNFILAMLQAKDAGEREVAAKQFLQLVENYPPAFLQHSLNNIGTHDTERIKEILHGDEKLVALAFGMLFMLPGVPCIYYGDEAGLMGKKDPDNRRFFPWGQESKQLQAQVADWAKFRHSHDLLSTGQVGIALGGNGRFAIIRYQDPTAIMYLVNLADQPWNIGTEPVTYLNIPEKIHLELARQVSGRRLAPKSGQRLVIKLCS